MKHFQDEKNYYDEEYDSLKEYETHVPRHFQE